MSDFCRTCGAYWKCEHQLAADARLDELAKKLHSMTNPVHWLYDQWEESKNA